MYNWNQASEREKGGTSVIRLIRSMVAVHPSFFTTVSGLVVLTTNAYTTDSHHHSSSHPENTQEANFHHCKGGAKVHLGPFV